VDRSRGCQDGSHRAVEAGAVRVQGRQSRGSVVAGNIYNAGVNDYTEPATTTLPTQREHHRSRLHLSPVLVSSWMLPRCRDVPPCGHA
jgi:hypothetical protein